MRVTLIHNPGAGAAKADQKTLCHLLQGEGHEVLYQSAKAEDWDEVLRCPAELVVAAGGDGTVGRVARRMAGTGIPVAALPLGTANNISRTLGIADMALEKIVRGWRNPRRVKLDVGVAEGPRGRRQFLEGVGIGLFAELLRGNGKGVEVGPDARPDEKVSDALERLRKRVQAAKAIEVKAKLDGHDVSGRYLMLEALNIPYVGPNLFLAPASDPGDGTFELVMVTEKERDRLLQYLAQWQGNRDRLAVLPTRSGKRLQIEWTGFVVHVDDKLWPRKKDSPPPPPAPVEARLEGASVEFLTAP